MNKYVAPIVGSALTALIAGTALAASDAPVQPQDTKAAAAQSAAQTPAATTPAAAPATNVKGPAKEESVKIGFVDLTQVAADTNEGKAATAALKARSKKLTIKIEAKQKQIEKQKAAIEAKLPSMSPKERAAKAKEFQKKMEEYQNLVRSSDQEMKEMQEKLTEQMYQQIKNAAIDYGKSHGFAAVMVKKETLYLAASVDSKDLSDEITAILNKKPESKSK